MNQRTTFIHENGHELDPSQVQLQKHTLHLKALEAAREDRLTISLYELPQELWRVLKQCHEIHIRWISTTQYQAVTPFVSRLSPGLHVFFTPSRDHPAELVCPLLRKLFGSEVQCISPEKTFTPLPTLSKRFASSAALQYYHLLPSLNELVTYIQQKICSAQDTTCKAKAASLIGADYLDIDYDSISHALVLKTFQQQPSASGTWNVNFTKLEAPSKIEVGVLTNENPLEPEELSFGGFLTVIGQDTKPNPTFFSFPSRHHQSPGRSGAQYHTSLVSPTGFHPSLRLRFTSTSMQAPSSNCALHTYMTLPSILFPDKYQLSSPLFLASKNLQALRSIAGETDLEAPDWVVSKWGSAMLMELAPPASNNPNSSPEFWDAEISLHFRYLPPYPGGKTKISIPWPVVFWACPADQGTKMSVNPFDRVNLGYDGLFGPRTIFYHLQPALPVGSELVEHVEVPVLDSEHMDWIENGTVVAVLIAVFWVMGKLWGAKQPRMGTGQVKESRTDAMAGIDSPGRQKLE